MSQNGKITIIQASSRSEGDTRAVSRYLEERYSLEFVDLKLKNIGQYDYENANANDDFLPTIKKIIETSDTIILLTPIYWYTMSGLLKTFLDRITELLKTEKVLGRKLRGKHLGFITNSNEAQLDYQIELPIKFSAEYLGMNYLGHIHMGIENRELMIDSKEPLDLYIKKCLSKKD